MARTLIKAHGIYGRDDSLIVGRHPLADRMLGILPPKTPTIDTRRALSVYAAMGGMERMVIVGRCSCFVAFPDGAQWWLNSPKYTICRVMVDPSDLAEMTLGTYDRKACDYVPTIRYEGLELSELRKVYEYETGQDLRWSGLPLVEPLPEPKRGNVDDIDKPSVWQRLNTWRKSL